MKVIKICIFCLLYLLFFDVHASENKECVIVLHGILKDAEFMSGVAEHMEASGYQVYNLDYPSTEHTISRLIDNVATQINELSLEKTCRQVHFVAHSLGGLITRGIINKDKPKNLGRVVMIGTPNHGSEISTRFRHNFLYKKISGPVGQELVVNNDGFWASLGEVNYELGIIAGNKSLNIVTEVLIKGADDGVVSVESTKLEGMKDHIIILDSHEKILENKETRRQLVHFLRTGIFEH